MSRTVTLDGYKIILQSVSCTGLTQTWTYRIEFVDPENPPSPEVSDWALALCNNPLHIVVNSSGPEGSVVVIGSGQPCLPTEDNTIKWESISNENVVGLYSFTLKGCWKEEDVSVALKAANDCFNGVIAGPGCTKVVKGRRGITLN